MFCLYREVEACSHFCRKLFMCEGEELVGSHFEGRRALVMLIDVMHVAVLYKIAEGGLCLVVGGK